MRAVAYCRVSTDTNDQINSLEMQKQFFEEYIRRSGHTFVDIYADEGVSGTRTQKRLEFQRLMRDAELGKFDILLVKDISRLARNTVDFLQCIRRLKALHIETCFLTANQTILGETELILTIFSAIAQEESANTSKRVKFGKKRNAKLGKVPNLVYGYDKIPGDYFNLEINAREAETVKHIFRLYTQNDIGTSKIARILNEKGVLTKRGNTWTSNGVTTILKNPLYTGKVINGKEEISDFLTGTRVALNPKDWFVVPKESLRLIEDQTFQKAQQKMQERRDSFQKKKERHSDTHLFSSLIKCSCCGKSFRRIVRKYKQTYIRWVCNTRNTQGIHSCQNSFSIDEQALCDSIATYMIQILSEKENVLSCIFERYQIMQKQCYTKSREKELVNRLNKIKKSRNRYMDLYNDDLISHEELRQKLSDLKQDMKLCTQELEQFQAASIQNLEFQKILKASFSDLNHIIRVEDMSNEQLRRIIQQIEIDPNGNVEIYLRSFAKDWETEDLSFCTSLPSLSYSK